MGFSINRRSIGAIDPIPSANTDSTGRPTGATITIYTAVLAKANAPKLVLGGVLLYNCPKYPLSPVKLHPYFLTSYSII